MEISSVRDWGLIAGGSVGGVVLLLRALRPFIPHARKNGLDAEIKANRKRIDESCKEIEVLKSKMNDARDEIKGLRTRCHDLANYISELQGRMSRQERK